MTAVALRLDREPRTPAPREAPSAERHGFAGFVERAKAERAPAPPPPKHVKKAPSAVPEAIEGDVRRSMSELLPALVPPQGSDLLPLPVLDEVSDGVPLAIDARGAGKATVDEEAQTLAVTIPPEMRALMHARTEIALPIILPDSVPVIPELVAGLAPGPAVSDVPLTPLEQAVQDLIASLEDHDTRDDREAFGTTPLLPEVKLLSIEHADAPAPVAPVAATEPTEPEQLNPSHVHLVIDDGAERVVVTVAVRGNEVNVALRGQDDATTAALARNAGSLDHAMRARGLDLASLMTGRDPDSQRQRPAREQRDREAKETFSLEELA